MAGFSSQSGQLGLKTQATPDVYASPATDGVFVKLRSGTLAPSRELMIPDMEIGGGRDTVDAYLGAVSFSGDFDFYGRMDAVATLLRACLGTAAAPVTASGVTTHTVTPTDASALPFLSVEERIGSGLEVFHYTDAVVNTFHLEADANGYLMGTAGLIARKQTAGHTATAAEVSSNLYDNSPMIVGTNITITYNGVTLPAKSFSLDVNNNVEDDDFRLGSFYIGDLVAKGREVTMGFSIRPQDSTLWRQATYGSAAATAPGGLTVKSPAVITMSTYETIAGSTPATPQSLRIEVPSSIIAPYALEPSGDDIIENDLEVRALRPVLGVPIMTCTVKTGKATIS